jgi:hypothetical protein
VTTKVFGALKVPANCLFATPQRMAVKFRLFAFWLTTLVQPRLEHRNGS